MNTSSDSSEDVIKEYIEEKNIDIPVLIDDGTFNYYMGISSFPTCVIFGPDRSPITGYSGQLSQDGFTDMFAYAVNKYEGN